MFRVLTAVDAWDRRLFQRLTRRERRLLGPILPLAGGVAYSRVHLRVHYPLDVLAGVMIGTTMGLASEPIVRAIREWWDAIAPVPEAERAQSKEVILVSSPHAGQG